MCSILDFIIYFRAPAVSLLSGSCDGSGLKAITNLRRRKRKALSHQHTASERNKFFRGPQVVAVASGLCLGGRLRPPLFKGCKHSVQKQPTATEQEGFCFCVGIVGNTPVIVSNDGIMCGQVPS